MPPPPTGRSSARPKRPSPTTAEVLEPVLALAGPSDPPDPRVNAYRNDLADIALAGRVIASHYAEPLDRVLTRREALRAAPSEEAEIVCELEPGAPLWMLDNSVGWAWGYAGSERLVGYVRSEAVTA